MRRILWSRSASRGAVLRTGRLSPLCQTPPPLVCPQRAAREEADRQATQRWDAAYAQGRPVGKETFFLKPNSPILVCSSGFG